MLNLSLKLAHHLFSHPQPEEILAEEKYTELLKELRA